MNTISNVNFALPGDRDPAGPPFRAPGLKKMDLVRLSRINPLISIYHIAGEWAVIIFVAVFCQHFWNPFLYLSAIVMIGARQHALLILMHDGAHYRLFRRRYLNEWISEVFLAWPHMVTLRSYRQNHLAHHQFLNTPGDPDWSRKKDNPEWQFPQSLKRMLGMFSRDLLGLGGINLIRLAASLKSNESPPSRGFKLARLAFYLGVVGTVFGAGGGKVVLLYWVVPYFTWLIFVMHIRSIAEHFAIDKSGEFGQTRTTKAGLLARILIAPKNVNYHIEHHMFPSVPFFRLRQLHKVLQTETSFQYSANITESYRAVVRDCTRRSGDGNNANQPMTAGRLRPWLTSPERSRSSTALGRTRQQFFGSW
jgi:fatty acid desaturase